jgi:hypothetical protein
MSNTGKKTGHLQSQLCKLVLINTTEHLTRSADSIKKYIVCQTFLAPTLFQCALAEMHLDLVSRHSSSNIQIFILIGSNERISMPFFCPILIHIHSLRLIIHCHEYCSFLGIRIIVLLLFSQKICMSVPVSSLSENVHLFLSVVAQEMCLHPCVSSLSENVHSNTCH